MRTFPSSSIGRLFDAVAAIAGFTRPVSFEGQAAMWLEHQARSVATVEAYPFPFADSELDFRPLLQAVVKDRLLGRNIGEIASAFHRGVAIGAGSAALRLAETHGIDTLVLSGGVFQNELLLREIQTFLDGKGLHIWMNQIVPPNDGGISLGQAALAAPAAILARRGYA